MSRAVIFEQYGGPEVLHAVDRPVPQVIPGHAVVRVRAAGVQPFDAMFRSGAVRERMPARFPQTLGNEFAGEITAVGKGVADFEVGTAVLGWTMQQAYSEHLSVAADQIVRKPQSMPWAEAGVISASGQTASTALEVLHIRPGDTLVVHGAAGGVGSFAVQIAVARGAKVIGTARPANHAYLRSLGAIPVDYTDDLLANLHAAADNITAVVIAAGGEQAFLATSELGLERSRVATVAFHPLAQRLEIQQITTSRSLDRLKELIRLYEQGFLSIEIARTFSLGEAKQAHALIETGHVRGKIVILP
jgi:enoyl reductase